MYPYRCYYAFKFKQATISRDVSEVYWNNLKWYTNLVWKSEFIIKPSKKGYKDEISKNIFKYFEVKFSEIRLESENLHPCIRQKSNLQNMNQLTYSPMTSSKRSVTLKGGPRSATNVLKDMDSSTRIANSSSTIPRWPRKLAWRLENKGHSQIWFTYSIKSI